MKYKAKMIRGGDVISFVEASLEALNNKIGYYRYDGYDLLSVENITEGRIIY